MEDVIRAVILFGFWAALTVAWVTAEHLSNKRWLKKRDLERTQRGRGMDRQPLTEEQRTAVMTIADEAFGHCDYRGGGHEEIEAALGVLGITLNASTERGT